jgi:hypothetical protein
VECPTCFQKVVVPQAPAMDDPKFIITGTKVGERPLPPIAAEGRSEAPTGKNSPLQVVVVLAVLLALIGAGAALVMQLHGKFSSPTNAPAQATETNLENRPVASALLAARLNDTNWTLNLDGVTIPDSVVTGYVHGKALTPERVTLEGGTFKLYTMDNPPTAGVAIYLHAIRSEDLAGQMINIKPDTGSAPWVDLRWKDAEDQNFSQTFTKGYALRLEFGRVAGGQLPGKIYLCTPDATRSCLMGAFNAQILHPR